MHERKGLADLRVGQGAQPTGFAGEKGGMDARAHGLDEEDFGEAIDNGGRAGLILRSFRGDDLQRGLERRRGMHRGEVDDGREMFDQQFAVGGGEGEAAGDDGGGCAAAAVGDEAGAVEILRGADFEDGAKAEIGGAAEGVGLRGGEKDEVAADEGHDGPFVDAEEAGAAEDDEADAFADGEFEGKEQLAAHKRAIEAWLRQHPEAAADIRAWRSLKQVRQETTADEPDEDTWDRMWQKIEPEVGRPAPSKNPCTIRNARARSNSASPSDGRSPGKWRR